MQERTFIVSVVIITAVFIGVTVAMQNNNAPAIRQMAEQQSQLITLLRKIDTYLSEGQVGAGGQPVFNAKFAELDKKLTEMLDIYHKVEKQAEAVKQQQQQPQRAQPSEEYTKVHEIPVAESTIKGVQDAPITITSFVDFQCPFSARFQPVIDAVLEAYPQKVNYVLKHFPLGFHSMAKPSGRAVQAAGEQGKYWEMVDLILKNSRTLSDEKFEEFAKDLGLNIKKFKKSYADEDGKWEKLIQADYDLGMKVGVRGTPTYYLNGRKTRSRTLEAFKQEIDEILSKPAE